MFWRRAERVALDFEAIGKTRASLSPSHICVDVSSSNTLGRWLNLINTDSGGRTWHLISTASANGEGAGKFLLRDLQANAVRMTRDTAGKLGIGTTSPLEKLQVAGNLRVGTGTNGCVRDADATVIAGTCSSDARFKRDITAFPKVLNRLAQLQPVHFFWNTREHPERGFGESLSFGLVAQEVERIMPRLVTEQDDGYKAERYNKLPLLMLQGIKELKADKRFAETRKRSIEAEVRGTGGGLAAARSQDGPLVLTRSCSFSIRLPPQTRWDAMAKTRILLMCVLLPAWLRGA